MWQRSVGPDAVGAAGRGSTRRVGAAGSVVLVVLRPCAAQASRTYLVAPVKPLYRARPSHSRTRLQRLGLTQLGCKLRAEWSEADEALFALGMLWYLRPNKNVQRRYLPHKTLHQLQVGTLPRASFRRPGLLGWPVQARPTPADLPHPCPTPP
jgi:hypothetical protein